MDKKNWKKRVTEGISSYQIIVNDLSSKDLDNRVHEWSPQSIKYNASGDKNLHRMMVIGTVDFLQCGNPAEEEIEKATILC